MNTKYINDKIFKALPEFVSFIEDVKIDNQPFFYFGNLGIFVRDAIMEEKSDIIDRAFDVLNELLNMNENELNSLINVGVLEILTDTVESQRAAIVKLNEKGRTMFYALFNRFNKLI